MPNKQIHYKLILYKQIHYKLILSQTDLNIVINRLMGRPDATPTENSIYLARRIERDKEKVE